MNEKAIFEIGDMIHVRYRCSYNPIRWFKPIKLTSKEIIETYEYKQFKKIFPELCRLAEES